MLPAVSPRNPTRRSDQMSESHVDDELQALGRHLQAAAELLNSPALARQIGPGTAREIRYALASFRQRFPDQLPGAQQPLL